jgi:hypothetical protein
LRLFQAEVRGPEDAARREALAIAREREIREEFSPIRRKLGGMEPLDELHTPDRPIKASFDRMRFTRHDKEDTLSNLRGKFVKTDLTAPDLTDRFVSIVISNARGVANPAW